jgi:hypothetical protein
LCCWFLGPVALQRLRGLGQLGWLSRRRVLSSRVRLVGVSISFKKNFYRLPFTPSPLSVVSSVLQVVSEKVTDLRIPTSLRSKDGVLGMGFGSSALRWQKLPDVAEADGSFHPR